MQAGRSGILRPWKMAIVAVAVAVVRPSVVRHVETFNMGLFRKQNAIRLSGLKQSTCPVAVKNCLGHVERIKLPC